MKRAYPESILPSASYCQTLDVDALLENYPVLSVVRQVAVESDDFVRSDSDIVGLSMNLLGGRYNVKKHLPFLPKSPDATRPWDGNNVNIQEYSIEDYTVTDPCYGAYFKVADIHNKVFPFRKSFSTQTDRDDFQIKAEAHCKDLGISWEERLVDIFVTKKEPVQVHTITKIVHAPVQMNYWHMMLEVLPIGEETYILPKERKKGPVRYTAKLIKMHLDQVLSYHPFENYRLKRAHYKKKVTLWDNICDALG